MARAFIFASAILLLSLPAASAQDGDGASSAEGTDPVLAKASIRSSPNGEGVEVIVEFLRRTGPVLP
jgi:hypothetical protein